MKKLKMGTPSMGIVIGLALVAVAVLMMIIGFWRTLLIAVLFAVGYFIGTVENKQEFIRNTANKIYPAKEAKVIDFKSEITRPEEKMEQAMAEINEEAADVPAGDDITNTEDGE